MAHDPHVSQLAANAEADAVGVLLNGGTLKFFSEADAVLATLRFATPAFNPATNGEIHSLPLAPDLSAAGAGDAVRFMAYTSEGAAVFGGSVGVVGSADEGDYNFTNSRAIFTGGEVHVGTLAYAAWHNFSE